MRSVRRWLFVAALAIAGAWIYVFAGSAASLLTLFDAVDDEAAVARVAVDQAPPMQPAAQEGPTQVNPDPEPVATSATKRHGDLLPQQLSTDNLSADQIMRLLEGEIAHDTDPAAADGLLRAFGESLDTQE